MTGEWKETVLSEVIDLIGGGTPKTSVAGYWNGDIPWLSVADFNTSRKYVLNAEKSITRLGLDNSSTKLLQFSDFQIRRHSMSKLDANPYLDRSYFLERKDRIKKQTPWIQTRLPFFFSFKAA